VCVCVCGCSTGSNGAGKTTLLSVLAGNITPTRGEAFVGGFSTTDEIDAVYADLRVVAVWLDACGRFARVVMRWLPPFPFPLPCGGLCRYSTMGVCPQFDTVFPSLTCGQHLRFYAKCKGVSPRLLEAEVLSTAAKVGLDGDAFHVKAR